MINFSLLDEAFPNEDKISLKKIKKEAEEKAKKEAKKDEKKSDCNPIQAPIYEIPNTCDNKQVFRNVMNDSMKNDYLNANDFKKDGIKPYDFDEMDAYLNVSNINTNNPDKSQEYRTTPFLVDYLKSLRKELNGNDNNNDKTFNIEQFRSNGNGNGNGNNNYIKIDNNLLLFMFLGIIIILLIDQITKLAIAIKSS